jgi:hypothetical protein
MDKDVDKDARRPEFTILSIAQNEGFCVALCEFLDIIIKKTLMSNDAQNIKTLIGIPDSNYASLWAAAFSDGKALFFEKLLRVS